MSTSGRKAYHHGDLRRALLTAGRELVGELGPAKVTLRAVAGRAQVSPAAPYRHFASKEALLAAVAAQGFDELADAMAAHDTGDEEVALRATGFAYLDFAVRQPELYRFMFGPAVPDRSRHAELAAAESRLPEILITALLAARHAGGMAPLEPDDVMLTMRCVMHGLASLVVDGQVPAEHAEACAKRIMDVVDTGLRPERPHTTGNR